MATLQAGVSHADERLTVCGIAGMLNRSCHSIDRAVLTRMCERIRHRGPDDDGYYIDGPVALGQRRLTVIDAPTGHQPMTNEDGSVWVTYNGEIYNFVELRDQLSALGHRFSSKSDTEVVVHAYEEYGPECVTRFRGMFAFALWDARTRCLFLARDHVGKKPLFYAEASGQFVFASELQALVEHPAMRRTIDCSAIDDYLAYGYIPAPKTIYEGVHKLEPGHYLVVPEHQREPSAPAYRPHRYWRLDYMPKLALSEDDAVDELMDTLREAVRLRLVADVPLGALLSGGVDSSLIVAVMSQLSDRPVKTFSIGFEQAEYNELAYARRVAQRYGTDHHELIVRSSAVDVLPLLVRHYGEPYADSSAIPSYYVAQMTRDEVTVALNGDGGDECFAGYQRYLGSSLADAYQRLPELMRVGLIEPLAGLVPESPAHGRRLRQAKHFVQVAGRPFEQRYVHWVTNFDAEQKSRLYSDQFQDELAGYDGQAWLLRQLSALSALGNDRVDTMLAADVNSYLPFDLLVKMDIASMANSLEMRSPFLDRQVMEFAARLPSNYKMRGTQLKYLLKKAARPLLPPESVDRRKMGFGVPVGQWMRGDMRPLVQDTLLSTTSLSRPYFRPTVVEGLVREHLAGTANHSSQLWSLLCLELWHREFVR